MQIETHKSLKSYNTFGIDVNAKEFIEVTSIEELQQVLKEYSQKEIFVLSGGSNILLTKDIEALVIYNAIKGIDIINESSEFVEIEIGAGENWHKTVLYCIKHNLGGIENLSLIPGNTGTAPIQNIGAYGVEIKDVFVCCKAVNRITRKLRSFNLKECNFGYRDSVFKNELKDKYIITSVVLRLSKVGFHVLKTSYGAINEQLANHKILEPQIKDISEAVIAIRSSKLPDPKKIGNSGSFFKNPVISMKEFTRLQQQFPEVPSYKVSEEEVKIPAGWLIEKAGFKGKTFGDYGVHKNQALVLVNYGNASGKDILGLAMLIKDTINRIFGISINPEVNIL